MRAAVYARYSSDLQSEASIDDQIRLCKERAVRDSMTVAEVFADYAISGGSLSNPPACCLLWKPLSAVNSMWLLPRP